MSNPITNPLMMFANLVSSREPSNQDSSVVSPPKIQNPLKSAEEVLTNMVGDSKELEVVSDAARLVETSLRRTVMGITETLESAVKHVEEAVEGVGYLERCICLATGLKESMDRCIKLDAFNQTKANDRQTVAQELSSISAELDVYIEGCKNRTDNRQSALRGIETRIRFLGSDLNSFRVQGAEWKCASEEDRIDVVTERYKKIMNSVLGIKEDVKVSTEKPVKNQRKRSESSSSSSSTVHPHAMSSKKNKVHTDNSSLA